MSDNVKPLLIGIVAGEASGDLLGADLIRSIKAQYPHAEFIGLGGEQMQAEGFKTLDDMSLLSVMGLVEPLKRLPQLLTLRRRLVAHFLECKPAVVVGIDAPDFNLALERKLKAKGIPTCHYVCPSVWAWRQGRVKGIRKSVDHVLSLLPFEVDFLKQHDIKSTFVGHPLAEQLSFDAPVVESELSNQLKEFKLQGPLLCVMPGSRNSEVQALLDVFMETIAACLQRQPNMRFVIPAASEGLYELLSSRLSEPDIHLIRQRILLTRGESQLCMQMSDLVLLASGTATLEAALLGKPMVVAYRLAPLSYAIMSRMIKIDYVALPNLLTDKAYVQEFIQHDISAESLSSALLSYIEQPALAAEVKNAFRQLHIQLAQNASEKAAAVVLSLAGCEPQVSSNDL
ncbi:MAG: lipid-A-disaccharide synthase [Pseudomonadales bacterium]